MHVAQPSLLLSLSLPAVLSGNIPARLAQGECLSWAGNTTTTVFNNCCRDVALETFPALALTALCPDRVSDYDPARFPDGRYTYSRLRLDGCLHLGKSGLVTMADVPPHEASELEDINSACDPSTFALLNDPPLLRGTCRGSSVFYFLDFLILSYRGIITCPGSRGVPSAPLDTTCCNPSLNTSRPDNPRLTATCQTNRFLQLGCQDVDGSDNWRRSTIPVNICGAFRPGLQRRTGGAAGAGATAATNGVKMTGNQAGCETTLSDEGMVLMVNCGGNVVHSNLSDFIRNEYGTLACYDYRGT